MFFVVGPNGQAKSITDDEIHAVLLAERYPRLIHFEADLVAPDEAKNLVTFKVHKDWPTPNACRSAAEALRELAPARYGSILDSYADAEDARFEKYGPIPF